MVKAPSAEATRSDAATPTLAVVVPCFNEAERLPRSLDRLTDVLDRRGGEYRVVVVDDGSRDQTARLARDHPHPRIDVVELGSNRGKGAAVRAGVLASSEARVLITDADLSTPIEELDRLEPHLTDAPIVIGSRSTPDAQVRVHQPFYREGMGKIFNRLLALAAVRSGVRDTQCGFKLLEGGLARSLFAEMITDGFAFDVELLFLARRRGCAVVEVGVIWENSPNSRVRLLSDPPRMLWEVLRFRLHHGRHGRRPPDS